jgi:osomolarity two-component system sensor histidine kinase NIK1
MPQATSVPEHPFLSHLVALLSIYDLEPNPKASAGTPAIPLPRYEGPRDLQTDAIERSLAKIALRLRHAEEKLGAVHPWAPRRNFEYDADLYDDQTRTPTARRSSQDLTVDPFDRAHKVSQPKEFKSFRAPSPMQISLDGLQHVSDPTKVQPLRTPGGSSVLSSPASAHPSPYQCPTCRRPVAKTSVMNGHGVASGGSSFQPSPEGSPLVVPPGPLSAAAFESGMSAVEELRLLKAQVQDVARVCKAVADGDLTQKITVPVQGPVMVQLKDVINTMVDKLGQFAKEVTRVSLEVGTEGYVVRSTRIRLDDGLMRMRMRMRMRLC